MPLNVTGYYYYSDEGHRVIKQYNAKDVPAIIIGNQVINYRDYDGNNSRLEQLILEALANQSSDIKPAITLPSNESQNLWRGKRPGHGNGQDLQKLSILTISGRPGNRRLGRLQPLRSGHSGLPGSIHPLHMKERGVSF